MNDTNVKYKKKVVIGDCTLILGDCLEVMPTLEKVDAVVTDPPYGIGASQDTARHHYAKKEWDKCAINSTHIDLMLSISDEQIIWGGNYFKLPTSRGYLIWDKLQPENFSLAMCELAWWSKDTNAKIFKKSVLSYSKEHPTQKPVELMKWCIEKVEGVILDCYMGSGTTLVACAKMGRKGIGIELDEDYFNIACKRIEEAYKSPDMFVAAPPKIEQDKLL